MREHGVQLHHANDGLNIYTAAQVYMSSKFQWNR